MKSAPKYNVGDLVIYKAGKRGYHYGLDNGKILEVIQIVKPLKIPNPKFRLGEFGGYTIVTLDSNMAFPAGWFSLYKQKYAKP